MRILATIIGATAILAAAAHEPLAWGNHPDIATRIQPEAPDSSFTFIMAGDPQSYVKFAANQPLFDLQTAWIADNVDGMRIRAALFTGDMVEQSNKLTQQGLPHPNNGNQTSRQQWEAASHALKYLDNRLPYIVCQGNHDVGYVAAESRFTIQNDYPTAGQ